MILLRLLLTNFNYILQTVIIPGAAILLQQKNNQLRNQQPSVNKPKESIIRQQQQQQQQQQLQQQQLQQQRNNSNQNQLNRNVSRGLPLQQVAEMKPIPINKKPAPFNNNSSDFVEESDEVWMTNDKNPNPNPRRPNMSRGRGVIGPINANDESQKRKRPPLELVSKGGSKGNQNPAKKPNNENQSNKIPFERESQKDNNENRGPKRRTPLSDPNMVIDLACNSSDSETDRPEVEKVNTAERMRLVNQFITNQSHPSVTGDIIPGQCCNSVEA